MMPMSEVQKHRPFSKADFERALNSTSRNREFYDWMYLIQWKKDDTGKYLSYDVPEIQEYCYFIPLTFNPERILKVYSSVDKSNDMSRDAGGDAIRVVLADKAGEPKHEAYTRINRTGNWETKLRIRISQILKSMGFNINCPRCGKMLFLRWNHVDNRRFLGCSTWPKCNGTLPFRDGQ